MNTVRSRCKRQLIQLNINKSGLHGLERKTRDPYSLVNDSLTTRTHCSSPGSCRAKSYLPWARLDPKTIAPPSARRWPLPCPSGLVGAHA